MRVAGIIFDVAMLVGLMVVAMLGRAFSVISFALSGRLLTPSKF